MNTPAPITDACVASTCEVRTVSSSAWTIRSSHGAIGDRPAWNGTTLTTLICAPRPVAISIAVSSSPAEGGGESVQVAVYGVRDGTLATPRRRQRECQGDRRFSDAG